MPRNPHVQTLGVANNEPQAQLVARDLNVRVPADMELLGEERSIIRVVPIGGQWHVQSWPVSALEWEQVDTDDVPFDLQGADVGFP